MNVLQRTLLVALLPVLFSLALGGYVIVEKAKHASQLIEAQRISAFEPILSNVVHELQRERGLSAGELGRQSGGENKALIEQYARTDGVFNSYLAALNTSDLKIPEPAEQKLRSLSVFFGDMESIRNAVKLRDIELPIMAKFYTSHIQTILNVMTNLHSGGTTFEGTNRQSYLALVQAKESMGLQRAMGANGFGKSKFNLPVYRNFISFIAQRNAMLTIFKQNASEEHTLLLDNVLNSEHLSEFRNFELMAIEEGLNGDLDGVTSKQWFDAITLLIDDLKILEETVGQHLITQSEDLSNAASSSASWTAITLILVVIGSVLYSIQVGKKRIASPIRELASVCDILSNDQQVRVPFMQRKDEIGDLSRSINSINKASISRKRVRAALQSANAQLMIVSGGDIKFIQPRLRELLIASSTDIDVGEKLVRDQPLKNLEETSLAVSACELCDGKGEIKNHRFGDRIFDLFVAVALDIDGEDLGVVIEWRDVTKNRVIEKEISALLEDASNGNFERRIGISTDDPTLGRMIAGINTLCSTVDDFINDLSESLKALAIGDLTRPVSGEYSGQLGGTKRHANQTIQSLTELIEVILDTAKQLDVHAVQLKTDSSQLASQTENQAAVLEETNATMQDITTNVVETATHTKDVETLILQTKSKVDGCDAVVRNTVEAIQNIEQSSAAISEITEIIQSISFQTNLLALNAAVEAARAGSAGSGFAVVASEVRALAKRSSEAASDIDSRIKSSEFQIERGVSLVNEAGTSLTEIQKAVVQVVNTINLITTANQSQTIGIQTIQASVNEIDHVTQHNAKVAEKSAQCASIIADKSKELTQQTGRFDLEPKKEQRDAA